MLEYIRREELIEAGNRVGVAVSGGADSVGLLQLLLELRTDLGIVLSVVHMNHKLRGAESDADEAFVGELARKCNLEFHSTSVDVAHHAAEEQLSIEAAARELRYGYFEELLGVSTEVTLDKIATGHTQDDQAETVLLRIVRGSGTRGLRAIQPRIPVEDLADEISGEIIRPLLCVRRHELEQYLGEVGQPWREDSSNADPKFTRNRVRHVLMPLLESEFNPRVTESLAELAEIARQEEDYWDGEVTGWMGTAVQWSQPEWIKGLSPSNSPNSLVQLQTTPASPTDPQILERMQEPGPVISNASISLGWFLSEPLAVQRRVAKAVAESLGLAMEFKHIESIIRFAIDKDNTGKELALPLGWHVQRQRDALVFVTPDLRVQERVPDYEYPLTIPGRTAIPDIYSEIEVLWIEFGKWDTCDPDSLLDPEFLSKELVVRNWRPGDRFWPAHRKNHKKLKELLQEKHIPAYRKRLWPVVVSGDEIVWVRGFPGRSQYRPAPGKPALLIREIAADGEP